MKKRLLNLIFFIALSIVAGAQTDNLCWSIDYHKWDSTGQPPLYIDCGNNDAFNLGGELTLEAWVRAYTFAENRKFMGKVLYNEPIDNGYVLGFENLHVYAEYFNPTKQEVPRPGDGPISPDSSIVHMAVTYSVSTKTIKSYVNGILTGETTMFPDSPIVSNDRPFIIGNAPWDMLSFQFYGDLDEVRVWNTALDQDQIVNTMHTQLSGNEDGLVAYYNFNAASNEVVPDEGINGFDGTLTNWDHESTSWATSPAPVGDLTMAAMHDVGAIWYRNVENYHKLITDNGIIVIGNIPEKDFHKYIVAGQNGNEGVTTNNMPSTSPEGFIRTNREWYFNVTDNVQGGLTITVEDAQTGADFPVDGETTNYALLYKTSADGEYRALAHPTIPINGIYQFIDMTFENGYYALGYSTSEFPIQGPDGISETIFANMVVAPNPAKDVIAVTGIPDNTSIKLLTLDGQLISEYYSTTSGISIDLSTINTGIYILSVENNDHTSFKKIIINK